MLSDDGNDAVWSVEEIGKVIGRDKRQTYYLLRRKLLPAKQLGRLWVASRRKLLAHVLG